MHGRQQLINITKRNREIDYEKEEFNVSGSTCSRSYAVSYTHLSGEATQKEFSKLKYSASDYSGAYNLANLTDTQSTTLAYELMKNLNVLSNVFSDNLYNELFNGKSSSGSARLGF